MAGEVALDSTVAIRFLNGEAVVVTKVTSQPVIILPVPVVGELLFGAENSSRPVENLSRYLQFIQACRIVPMGQETAPQQREFVKSRRTSPSGAGSTTLNATATSDV